MGIRSLRMEGVDDSLNTLLPICVSMPNLVIWSNHTGVISEIIKVTQGH